MATGTPRQLQVPPPAPWVSPRPSLGLVPRGAAWVARGAPAQVKHKSNTLILATLIVFPSSYFGPRLRVIWVTTIPASLGLLTVRPGSQAFHVSLRLLQRPPTIIRCWARVVSQKWNIIIVSRSLMLSTPPDRIRQGDACTTPWVQFSGGILALLNQRSGQGSGKPATSQLFRVKRLVPHVCWPVFLGCTGVGSTVLY